MEKFKLPKGLEIVATSRDQYDKLEEAMELFFRDYGFKLEGIARVTQNFSGAWGGATISPKEDGYSHIEEVVSLSDQSKVNLIRSAPGFVVFNLDNNGYMVNFGPVKAVNAEK